MRTFMLCARFIMRGGFGKIVYSEGEYYHYTEKALPSYNNWRGGPPQWYPTHSNAYYICVTGGSFTEVSCLGTPTHLPLNLNKRYNNPYVTEVALFRTSEGGMARMVVSSDTPGDSGGKGTYPGAEGFFLWKI